MPRYRLTTDQKKEIFRLISEGDVSFTAIARQFGITLGYVSQLAKAAGLQKQAKKDRAERKKYGPRIRKARIEKQKQLIQEAQEGSASYPSDEPCMLCNTTYTSRFHTPWGVLCNQCHDELVGHRSYTRDNTPGELRRKPPRHYGYLPEHIDLDYHGSSCYMNFRNNPFRRRNPLPHTEEVAQAILNLRTQLGISRAEFAKRLGAGLTGYIVGQYESGKTKCSSVGLLQDMKILADRHGIPFVIRKHWMPRAAQERYESRFDGDDLLRRNPRGRPSRFTPEQKAEIIELCKDKTLRLSDIARRFGVTLGHISNFCRKAGVSRYGRGRIGDARSDRKLNYQQIQEIKELCKDSNLSYAAIGSRYGVTGANISYICRKAGIKRYKRGKPRRRLRRWR